MLLLYEIYLAICSSTWCVAGKLANVLLHLQTTAKNSEPPAGGGIFQFGSAGAPAAGSTPAFG